MAAKRGILGRLRARREQRDQGSYGEALVSGAAIGSWVPEKDAGAASISSRWATLAGQSDDGPIASTLATTTTATPQWQQRPTERSAAETGSGVAVGQWLLPEDGSPAAAPVEAEQAPVEAEQAPVEAEQAPVEAEQAPVEAEQAPVEVEQPSAEGEVLSASRRRRLAVEAYCNELCHPEAAAGAAADALGSFADGDAAELLRTLRALAGRQATVEPEQRRGWRRMFSGRRERECSFTPALLAARANDELDQPQRDRFEAHLASCVLCQAFELRAQRAERAFAGILGVGAPFAAAAAALSPPTAPPAIPEPPVAPLAVPEPPAVLEPPVAPLAVPEPTAVPEPPASEWVDSDHRDSDPSEPSPPFELERAAALWLATGATLAAAEHGHPPPAPDATAATSDTPPLAESPTPPATDGAPEPPQHARRRRLGLIAAGAGVAAVAIAAFALATGSAPRRHPAEGASAVVDRVHTTQARTPARAQSRRRTSVVQRRTAVVHPRTTATAVAVRPQSPAPVSSSPSSSAPSQPTSGAPTQTSGAPTQASGAPPTPSSGVPAPTPSSPPPQPSASIQQPTLGTASAPQGLGSGH